MALSALRLPEALQQGRTTGIAGVAGFGPGQRFTGNFSRVILEPSGARKKSEAPRKDTSEAGARPMMRKQPVSLTVATLARTEAAHLRACFESIRPLTQQAGVETLVILDSRTDDTATRVARHVAQRVVTSEFVNFAVQRNRALDVARSDWLFFIDTDERCTPALLEEIVKVIESRNHAAYRVPRRNFLFKREVRHTGWWPDYQIRLLKRDRCRYDESRHVHELPVVDGTIGTLAAPLIHFNYDSWSQFIAKQRTYARLDAQARFADGKRARPRNFIGQPWRELKRRFVEYEGYKDGLLGLALSLAMALYTAETYRQLYLLQRRTWNVKRET